MSKRGCHLYRSTRSRERTSELEKLFFVFLEAKSLLRLKALRFWPQGGLIFKRFPSIVSMTQKEMNLTFNPFQLSQSTPSNPTVILPKS